MLPVTTVDNLCNVLIVVDVNVDCIRRPSSTADHQLLHVIQRSWSTVDFRFRNLTLKQGTSKERLGLSICHVSAKFSNFCLKIAF